MISATVWPLELRHAAQAPLQRVLSEHMHVQCRKPQQCTRTTSRSPLYGTEKGAALCVLCKAEAVHFIFAVPRVKVRQQRPIGDLFRESLFKQHRAIGELHQAQ